MKVADGTRVDVDRPRGDGSTSRNKDARCSAPGLSLRLQLLDGESVSEVYLVDILCGQLIWDQWTTEDNNQTRRSGSCLCVGSIYHYSSLFRS